MVSNSHYACPSCRATTKYSAPTHDCGKPMVYMGKNFRPPRKSNKAQWRKIELAAEHRRGHHPNCFYSGYAHMDRRWRACRCSWFANFQTLADVKSGLGLRRSRKRNWAKPARTGHQPMRPRYDHGR
jgi:hypothetical protein